MKNIKEIRKNYMKNTEIGITLIALVITIIVLLILAGVSISIIMGNNGILKQTDTSVEKTYIATEKEQIALAYTALQPSIYNGEKTIISAEDLQNEINNTYGTGTVSVKEDLTTGTLKVTYISSKREYVIDSDEKITLVEDTTENNPPDSELEEPTITLDNNIANFKLTSVGNTGLDADTYYFTNLEYPVELYSLSEYNFDSYKVKMYVKEADQTDDEYQIVKMHFSGTTQELEELQLSSANELIFCTGYDYEKQIVLKVEYELENGSKIYCVSDTINSACFVAGTKILTENGLMNIEEIEKGMKVYSKNFETGKNEIKTVLSTSKKMVKANIYKVDVGDEYIKSTGNHPYYEKTKGFLEAKDLTIGDVLIDIDGNELIVEDIEIIESNESIIVYNMNVENNHNYFVGEKSILVHNATACPTSPL